MNEQKPEGVCNDIEFISIIKVWPTIQGEGPLSGTPAIFVRLAGCQLRCPNCDTNYTSNRSIIKVNELIERIESVSSKFGYNLVVFTGGEPFRQAAVVPVIDYLIADGGYVVQVETNGTIFRELPEGVAIVCSPKTGIIAEKFYRRTNTTYKYVVEAGHTDSNDGLPTKVLGMSCRAARPPKWLPRNQIYVQPQDEDDSNKKQANIDEAVKVCMKHGYRLSLQIHKLVGLE